MRSTGRLAAFVPIVLVVANLAAGTGTAAALSGLQLVRNPSFETGPADQPARWTGTGTGVNTRRTTTVADAHSGLRAARAEITSYTSGDVAWVPDPRRVTARQPYTFSVWVKADVPTELVLQARADGVDSTLVLASLPAGAEYTQRSVTFVAPPGRHVRVSAFVRLSRAGWVVTDDYSLVATPVPPRPGGKVMASVALDDGRMDQFRNARPALLRNGFAATYYVISDALAWGPTHMTEAEVRQLAWERNEVGNHTQTHPDLTALTAPEIRNQLLEAQYVLLTRIGVTAATCAYPGGAYNAAVLAAAARYVRTCRGVEGGLNAVGDTPPYALRTYYVTSDTTADDIRAALDGARVTGSWIIFTYHGVTTEEPQSRDDVTAASFSAHLDAIRESGIPVRTVSAAYAALGR